MESAGQNRNLQGISPQIVNLALQNGIISSTLNPASLQTTLDVACSSQAPSTSFSAIVPTQPLSVPFFETETFKNVNLNVAPSSLLSGLDLPTDDVTTLRFFYNLGVQALRNYQYVTNSAALPQVAQCVTSSTNRLSLSALQNEQQVQLLREYRERQLASQQAIRDLQTQFLKTREISGSQSASQQIPLLYPSPTVPPASTQLDNLLLQNSLMNSSVDWRAFNELVVRARMFTAALDMVPAFQNDSFHSHMVSTENATNESKLKSQEEPLSPLTSNGLACTSSDVQPSLIIDNTKAPEDFLKQEVPKGTAQRSPSPIAQPLPIRPKPNNHVAIYDMQVSHSLLAASEMHYNETFKKAQSGPQNHTSVETTTAVQQHSANLEMISNVEQEPQVSPQLLINLINTYLTKVKKQLYNKGVGLHLDSQGLPIDFSARPVDPIFRNAREQLDSIREYRDSGTPLTNHMAVDLNRRSSPSLKEAEIVESAAERLQQSASREREIGVVLIPNGSRNDSSDKFSQTINLDLHKSPSEVLKETEGGQNWQSLTGGHECEDANRRCAEQACTMRMPAEKRRRIGSSGN